MRLGSWFDAAREASVSQRKKERERQALFESSWLVESFDFCYCFNIVCLFPECGRVWWKGGACSPFEGVGFHSRKVGFSLPFDVCVWEERTELSFVCLFLKSPLIDAPVLVMPSCR